MYEPLHHKYRPQTFAQLVGQGAIAQTLTHALQQNRIAPAYLFCGPRGTGKTSSARILAKSLNCLKVDTPTPAPCGECDVCQSVTRGSALDIVEIDAASNTGVDNIRELIERTQFAPVQCRYKVYVIDECHMLSTAAFNALLKTLEEPPDRVVFVLATTDPQRVLPTIISRCQRFDFRRIPLPAMIKHLHYIAATESINIAESAIQLVAQISQGGLRDAESLLDQLSLQTDEITVETVWDLVGAVPERDLLNLVRAIAADNGPDLLAHVRHLMDKGREPLIVLQSLVGFYRDLLIAKSAPAREDLVAITPPTWAEMTTFAKNLSVAQLLASQQKLQTSEVQVKNTTQPRLWLEITLTGLLPSALGAVANLATGTSSFPSAPTRTSVPPSSPSSPPTPSRPPDQNKGPAPARPTTPTHPIGTSVVANETDAIAPVKPSAPAKSTDEPIRKSTPPTINTAKPISQLIEPVEPPSVPPVAKGVEPTAEKEPVAEVAFDGLDDLWVKILAALEPRGTQMLMNQQGTLLAFDNVTAKVGFRSASLQKLAQQRVPNLEKALAAIFQRPIKVSLEVAAAGSQKPEQQSPTPSVPSAPALPKRHPSTRQSNPTPSSPPPKPAANNNPKEDPVPPPRPTDHLPSAPTASTPTPGQWQSNQEQDNIKRFADFFNGQIVNLDDDDDEPSGGTDPTSSTPDPDVPF